MKLKFGYNFLFVIVVYIASLGLFAQEVEEYQEEEGATNVILSEYWDKHAAIRLGTSLATSVNSSDYRNYYFANVSWQHNFDWIAFNFEGEVYRSEYRSTLDLESSERIELDRQISESIAGGIPMNDPSLRVLMDRREDLNQDEFIFTDSENDIIYREANVKLISEYVQVSGGYHTVVWGQSEGSSAVDSILPLRFASGNLGISKVDNRIPQLSGIVSIFPLPWIEVQAYYFPELTLDVPLRKFYEEERSTDLDLDDGRQDLVRHGFQYPKNSEIPQYAGRVLFYFNKLTFGLIYHEGWDQFNIKSNSKISRQMTTNIRGLPYQYVRYENKERLARVQNYGFESSFALGSWNIRLDILQHVIPKTLNENKIGITSHNFNEENSDTLTLDLNQQQQQDLREELFDFAIEKNNSSFDYEVRELRWSGSVDTDGDTWFFSFGFVSIDESFTDDNGSQLVDYADRIDLFRRNPDQANPIATEANSPSLNPIFTLIRYISEDKQDIVGFSIAYRGDFTVYTFYFGQEYFEALRIDLAWEEMSLSSNGSETERDAFERDVLDGYELKDQSHKTFRFITSYKF